MTGDRVALADGWTLWPWIWVRAAGFRASILLELASASAADAADALTRAEQERARLQDDAIRELRRLHESGSAVARAARGAAEQLERGRVPRVDPELDAVCRSLPAFRSAQELLSNMQDALEHAYGEALAQTARTTNVVARDPQFREALLWQNPQALRTGVDWLVAHPDAANKRARQNQHLVASYLQRYCAKNDTIGFFGPIAWGQLTAADTFKAAPGPLMVGARGVHFEFWAIDAVAAALATWPEVRPSMAPRLVPSARLDGTTLTYGLGRAVTLPEPVARLLAACDGRTTARDIALALCADTSLEMSDLTDVYDLLDELVQKKLVVWTLEPACVTDPDRALGELLERIADSAARDRALAVLRQLQLARQNVADAAGALQQLDAALSELDQAFKLVTGEEPSRRGGQTYAGRTLVYEDCVRDIELTVGARVTQRLAPLFTLVAQSARWFTYELATRLRCALRERYITLAATSSGSIGYVRFLHEVADLLPQAGDMRGSSPVADEVVRELEQRWSAILRWHTSERRVELRAADIAVAVREAFAAPMPGWAGARHIAPDVMISARDAGDIERGAFSLVLGEVHIGNTFFARFIRPYQPDAGEALIAAYDADRNEPAVVPVPPRDQVTRAQTLPWSVRDFDLELGTARSWKPRDRVLRAADLVVELRDRDLVVRELGTDRVFDIITVFESYLMIMTGGFRPVPTGAHVPRISVDGTVLCREQWRFTREEMPTFDESTPARSFAAVRRWALQHGIPRFVFMKVPEEPKPTFVDFASPLYVSMFIKTLRKASVVSVSEMLPGLDECWLPDADGKTYTSELRMIAVDPVPWAPAHGDGKRGHV